MSNAETPRITAAERVYSLLLCVYPSTFRDEFGSELRRTFLDWHRGRSQGVIGFISFWAAVLTDLARSVPVQWALALREHEPAHEPPSQAQPPYLLAGLAGAAVFGLYAATLAPSIGFWDSGEYTAVAHALGIPHPPGSPLSCDRSSGSQRCP